MRHYKGRNTSLCLCFNFHKIFVVLFSAFSRVKSCRKSEVVNYFSSSVVSRKLKGPTKKIILNWICPICSNSVEIQRSRYFPPRQGLKVKNWHRSYLEQVLSQNGGIRYYRSWVVFLESILLGKRLESKETQKIDGCWRIEYTIEIGFRGIEPLIDERERLLRNQIRSLSLRTRQFGKLLFVPSIG